ncbi:MAG: Hpt domain-containing protein [Lysobacterales bacterium]
MAASTLQYENELVRIRRQYLDSLPEKIHDLENALSGLSGSDRPDAELKALNRIAHQLAASAGSHGFTEVSNAAKELDLAFDDVEDSAELTPDVTVAKAVQEMGDALVDLLRQVPS